MGGITTKCLSILAANMAGSSLPTYIAIGIGSTAFVSGNTALVSESDRNQINTTDLSTGEEVTFISNWTPVEISGTILKEQGTFTTGSDMLARNVLAGSLVFDGESELQIQQTFKFFI